jgi:hypothetical protein
MDLLKQYLDRAAYFQSLAEAESNPKLKEQLRQQAMAYLKLASKWARELGVPPPKLPKR